MARLRTLLIHSVLNGLVRLGIPIVIPYLFPKTLTVLNYHRINDPHQEGFDALKINVSATPSEFAKQMDYLVRHFNVITCNHLAAWLRGEKELPPRAAIITFDDGYHDNFLHAYPVLKSHNLPAVIFLATDYMETDNPFYWDYIAYCFYHTKKDHAHLPLTGDCFWSDEQSRDHVMQNWIEVLKTRPETEKQALIHQISNILDVPVPSDAFANLFLTWDQIREMSQNGIEFGSHTTSHPILTRIPLDQARKEIVESKKKIETEIGVPVVSLAYPNGGAADFSPDVMQLVAEAGIPVAFSLLAGPTSYTSVRRDPLSIRRVFLAYYDTFPRFLVKVLGGARLLRI